MQAPGEPSGSGFIMGFGFPDIPTGTDGAGWWRVQAGEDFGGSDLNTADSINNKLGANYSLYIQAISGTEGLRFFCTTKV
jgi:hypothetical protein